MGPRLIVIGGIRGQNPPQMPRPEDENVIQAVAPQRSDQAFRVWVLPRRYWSVSDPHRPNPPPEDGAAFGFFTYATHDLTNHATH